ASIVLCSLEHEWMTRWIFDTKNVAVGQNVTLNCSRDHRWLSTNLFWIRLASQSFPEVLGSTISHDVPTIGKIHNITTKQEPGTFVLHINRAQLNDTAVYYCIKERPDPGITGVTQDSLSNPVHPGDPVTLQCSVLSNSENRTCTEDHSVYWYRAKPDESHPSLIYSHGNNGNYYTQKRCIYRFSKHVSSSDGGTYYCAVATCGEILFGNGTKLDIHGTYYLSLKFDTWMFSAAVFTLMKAERGALKDGKMSKRQRLYMACKALGLD
uniref:Ig-like domain-containing protein n=1 Tax=Maylandia zebra TaxID=106582 RepID=A0A3P9DV08_9CICH